MTSTFADRLIALREAAGFSNHELARRSGVPQQYISALQRGRKDDPSWRVVCLLADALGVSTEEFRK